MIRKLSIALILLVIIGLLPLPAYAQEVPTPEVSTPTDSTSTDQAPLPTIDPLAPASDPLVTTPQPLATEPTTTELAKDPNVSLDEGKEVIPQPDSQPNALTTSIPSGPNPNPNQAIQLSLPKVSESTGAATYAYAFGVPSGVNGLTPEVNLSYNSQTNDDISPYGYGWNLSIPFIERSTKKGSLDLYSREDFTSSMSGDLVKLSAGQFAPRLERGDFVSYAFANNIWTATTKTGIVYEYGAIASARLFDPQDSSRIFRWMLTKITTPNNQSILYFYYKVTGEAYPYLSMIQYGDSAGGQSGYQIQFSYTARTVFAPDASGNGDEAISYRPGFLIKTAQVLSNVSVEIPADLQSEHPRQYGINYSKGENGKRLLLADIEEFAFDAGGVRKSLPKTKFEYSKQTDPERTWTQASWTMPGLDTNGFTTKQTGYDSATRVADLNADGLPDLITRVSNKTAWETGKSQIWINTGSGFTQDPSWAMPSVTFPPSCTPHLTYELAFDNTISKTSGLWLQDINGDNKADLISIHNKIDCTGGNNQTDVNGVWLNTGSAWQFSAWTNPSDITASDPSGFDTGLRLADINSDNLPDLVLAKADVSGRTVTPDTRVWLNTGSAWQLSTSFVIPNVTGCKFSDGTYESVPLMFRNYADFKSTGNYLADTNGDGLLDFVMITSACHNINLNHGPLTAEPAIYLNNGSTWVTPEGINNQLLSKSNISDVNADGHADLIWSDIQQSGNSNVQSAVVTNDGYHLRSFGGPWVGSISWNFPTELNCDNSPITVAFQNLFVLSQAYQNSGAGDTTSTGLQIMDINGDGLPDFFNLNHNAPCFRFDQQGQPIQGQIQSGVWLNQAKKPDLLNKIIYPAGGFTTLTYKSALAETIGGLRANPKLPYAQTVVGTITNNDGAGLSGVTSYSYADGDFYLDPNTLSDSTVSGFGLVTTTAPDGGVTKVYFHQGNGSSSGEPADSFSRIGIVYKTENFNAQSQKMSDGFNLYTESSLSQERFLTLQAQTVSRDFEGGVTHKDKAQSINYDALGNPSTIVSFGEVSADGSGNFSDIGTDLFTTTNTYATKSGNLTGFLSSQTITDQSSIQKAQKKNYYDQFSFGVVDKGNLTSQAKWISGATYATTQTGYNSAGVPTSQTDARGKTTNIIYDAHNLQPITVTNPLTQQTIYSYDYSSGKPKEVTEASGAKTRFTYDMFDRETLKEQNSDPSGTSAYRLVGDTSYIDTSGSMSASSYNYLTSDQGKYNYQKIYFDGLMRPIRKANLFNNINEWAVSQTIYDASGRVQKQSLEALGPNPGPIVPANLFNTFTYDTSGRILTSSNSIGSSSVVYVPWSKTETNPKGVIKDYNFDSFGNLQSITEHNSGSLYTTNYAYDVLGNLTGLTDALGNVRSFAYDGLSRKTSATDLHAPADATYGTWSYSYDDNGNLQTSTSPNNDVVNYSYDDLNRLLTEDLVGSAPVEITNTYDTCIKGVGRLCSTTTPTSLKTFEYSYPGNVTKESLTIDAQNYQTLYTYDLLGNLTDIQNPDSSKVKYLFSTTGKITSVQRQESTDASPINLATSILYAPTGQVASINFANGTITTNTYDANQMYRLSRKLTTGPGGSSSSTTVTFNPATGDGSINKQASSWNTARTATSGTTTTYTGATYLVSSGKNASNSFKIERGFIPFNTSSLPDSAQIVNAKLKVYVDAKLNNYNDTKDWVSVVQGSEPSTTTLANADYDLAGAVSNPQEGIDTTERKDISSVATGQYLVFNLNTAGQGWVSKTGSTKLALREGHDVTNTTVGTGSGLYNQLTLRGLEYTGTTSDPILEVTYLTGPPAPTVLQDLNYSYDAVGNITQIVDASLTDSAKTTNYTYDDLDRLLSATVTGAVNGNNGTKSYAYNAIGNLLTGDPGSYLYAGTGYANPHAATSVGGIAQTYDNNGNLLNSGILTNTWDYNNRLLTTVKSGVTSTSVYDATGQRIKLGNGTSTSYYPTKSYNTDSATPQKHIFLGDTLLATIKGTGASATVAIDHTDQISGTGPVTDISGGMVQLLDYYPYGGARINSNFGGYNEQRQFTGLEYDVDTGLNYAVNRYYNSAIGRFISQDPAFVNLTHLQVQLADPQSWNSYSYARNNPLAYMDPDGNMWTPWQSSGGFNNWMGNGGLLYNVYGSNVNSITNTARNIQQNGWTKDNVMALGADAASITAKTSGIVVGSVGVGMGAGAAVNVLSPAAATTGTAACASGGCQKAQEAVTRGINLTSQGMLHAQKFHSLESGLVNPTTVNKSYFYNFSEVPDLVQKASGVNPVEQFGKLYRVVNAAQNIGVNQATKQPTSSYTVITDKFNNLINTFPGIANNLLKK